MTAGHSPMKAEAGISHRVSMARDHQSKTHRQRRCELSSVRLPSEPSRSSHSLPLLPHQFFPDTHAILALNSPLPFLPSPKATSLPSLLSQPVTTPVTWTPDLLRQTPARQPPPGPGKLRPRTADKPAHGVSQPRRPVVGDVHKCQRFILARCRIGQR